jgi:hypothetical protein
MKSKLTHVVAVAAALAALTAPAMARSAPHEIRVAQNMMGPGNGARMNAGAMGQGMQGSQMGPGAMGRHGYGMGRGMMGGMMMSCPLMGAGMGGQGHMYTEGRLAFLKAELKIKSSQESAWNAYSSSVKTVYRNAGQTMRGMWSTMMGGANASQPAPQALQARINLMEAQLKNLKAMRSATAKLYEHLDESQKKTADQFMGGCNMGRMWSSNQ